MGSSPSLRPEVLLGFASSLFGTGTSVSFCLPPASSAPASNSPLGILTLAYGAHLNETEAFPGLSVFEGEKLSTEAEGRIGVRVGNAMLAFSGTSGATLHRIECGLHVDMTSGTLFFSSPANGSVEVHAEGAVLRPEKNEPTQTELTILRPKVVQISARHGNLAFSYTQGYLVLPEGDTYRIYLDAPAQPQNAAGAGGAAASHAGKTVFFIVAGSAATGAAAWGIHEVVTSGNGIERPAKP